MRGPRLVILAMALVGCQVGQTPRLQATGTLADAAGSLVANTGGALVNNSGGALVNNSGGALVNNSGGALVNNSGGAFSGTVLGPQHLQGGQALIGNAGAGLVNNSGGAYRIAGLAQTGLAGAYMYLTTPDERFFALGGRPIMTTTDTAGHYDFGRPVVPEGQHVVVNALLSGNRRLVGFAVTRLGQNVVDVDVATTYVLEFLRAEARRVDKTFGDFDLGRLPEIVRLTAELLADGRLGLVPDHLVVGQSRFLVDDYAAAFVRRSPELRTAWRQLLGGPTAAVWRFAGNGSTALSSGLAPADEFPVPYPLGVAAGPGGSVVGMWVAGQIATIDEAGVLSLLTASATRDPNLEPRPPIPAGGSVAASVRIPEPLAVALDPEGNVFVTMLSPTDAPRNQVLLICRDPAPKFGLTDLEVGRVYLLAGTPGARSDDVGFRNPAGLTLDPAGNLYVADRNNDRVMRIDRATGKMTRIAGTAPDAPFVAMTDLPAPARSAQLFRPVGLALLADGADLRLFVADTYFQRIREVRAPGGDWSFAQMTTLAGSGAPVQAGGAQVVPGGFADGPAAQARFDLVRVDPTDWRGSDFSSPGLACDAARRRLYVADTRNGRVRAIDLVSGSVTTMAGGGAERGDGLAANASFLAPAGLAILPDGDLLVADPDRHVVRRIAPGD